jgi:hypothetical protein
MSVQHLIALKRIPHTTHDGLGHKYSLNRKENSQPIWFPSGESDRYEHDKLSSFWYDQFNFNWNQYGASRHGTKKIFSTNQKGLGTNPRLF